MDNAAAPGLTIEDSARRLGALRWVELALHRLLGGWVQGCAAPSLKLAIAEFSEHHGWHGELLEARIPNVRALSAETQTVGSPGAVALIDALERLGDEVSAAQRLALYVRSVIPQLVEAYDTLRADCSPVSDAPALRTIRFIRDDLTTDFWAGSAQVLAALTDVNEIAAVGVLGGSLEMIRHDVGALSPR